MSESLDPCPFCGNDCIVMEKDYSSYSVYAHCVECHARGPLIGEDLMYPSVKSQTAYAIEQWNARVRAPLCTSNT